MILIVLSFLMNTWCLVWQQDVHYKPSDEFVIELDFKFKQRLGVDHTIVDFTETREEQTKKQSLGAPLPYLVLKCKILKLQTNEVRVRAISNTGHMLFSRKAQTGLEFKLDIGFTDDMKDRVTAHEVIIYFLSSSKEDMSRIRLNVMEDGTFTVNDEIRGKF